MTSPNGSDTHDSYLLNYKKIPYKTVWLSYPDIKDTLQELGFRPSAVSRDGTEHWTLPVISDPSRDGGEPTRVVDSHVIAEYLEAKYPQNPVFPPGTKALQSHFIKWTSTNLMPHLSLLTAPQIIDILDERAKPYFDRTRRIRWGGKELKDVCVGDERKATWAAARKEFDLLEGHLSRNEGGDYLMGTTVSYGDFILAAFFMWMKKAPTQKDPGCDTIWDVMKDWNDGRWARLVDSFKDYETQN